MESGSSKTTGRVRDGANKTRVTQQSERRKKKKRCETHGEHQQVKHKTGRAQRRTIEKRNEDKQKNRGRANNGTSKTTTEREKTMARTDDGAKYTRQRG